MHPLVIQLVVGECKQIPYLWCFYSRKLSPLYKTRKVFDNLKHGAAQFLSINTLTRWKSEEVKSQFVLDHVRNHYYQ